MNGEVEGHAFGHALDYTQRLEAEVERLRDGIREVLDHPLVLPQDDATDVASYFVTGLRALVTEDER